MRGTPTGWSTVRLHEVSNQVDYGLTAADSKSAAGPKFLRITDIQNQTVDWSSVHTCECDDRTQSKLALAAGDIVFARTGKSTLLRDCPTDSVFASCLIRVRPNERVLPDYLARFFQTPDYWRQITRSSIGTAQPRVNLTKLKQLNVPLPPLSEQRRIAAILNQVDAVRKARQEAIGLTEELQRSVFLETSGVPVVDSGLRTLVLPVPPALVATEVAARQADHVQQLNTLFGSLLQRAFRGELQRSWSRGTETGRG